MTSETRVNLTFIDCWHKIPLLERADLVSELAAFAEVLMEQTVRDLRAEPGTLGELAGDVGIGLAKSETDDLAEVQWPEEIM